LEKHRSRLPPLRDTFPYARLLIKWIGTKLLDDERHVDQAPRQT
jgi:hypothetical protein